MKLLRGKIKLKVFGKGSGGEPFFRKVSPDRSRRYYDTARTQRGFAVFFLALCENCVKFNKNSEIWLYKLLKTCYNNLGYLLAIYQ